MATLGSEFLRRAPSDSVCAWSREVQVSPQVPSSLSLGFAAGEAGADFSEVSGTGCFPVEHSAVEPADPQKPRGCLLPEGGGPARGLEILPAGRCLDTAAWTP